MKITRDTILTGGLAAGITLLSLGMALAEAPMAGAKDMTLYSFDKDMGGVSACYDDCAKNWPPYLGKAGDKMEKPGWTLVERTDKTMQWAYDGKPAYYFIGDTAAGQTNGDGKGGVWHTLTD